MKVQEKEVKAVLRRARDILTPESAWMGGGYATDKSGNTVPPHSSAACRWCLTGAIYRHAMPSPSFDFSLVDAVVDRLLLGIDIQPDPARPGYMFCALIRWNDVSERTHAEVLALLDRAIAA